MKGGGQSASQTVKQRGRARVEQAVGNLSIPVCGYFLFKCLPKTAREVKEKIKRQFCTWGPAKEAPVWRAKNMQLVHRRARSHVCV